MEYAGFIEPRHHGPDMPMNARLISRLPWTVMKRVIGDKDGSDRIMAMLSEKYPPGNNQKWQLDHWINAQLGTFHLVEHGGGWTCDDCCGEGEILVGRHHYECRECYGSGLAGDVSELLIMECEVTWDGVIMMISGEVQ